MEISAKAAVLKLTKEMALIAPLQALTGFELIRHTPRSTVLKAQQGAETVIIKQFYGPKKDTKINTLQKELEIVSAHMNNPAFRVIKCLDAFPESGIALFSFAPGETISQALRHASPAQRYETLAKCGQWHESYIGERTRTSQFLTGFWQKRLAKIDIPDIMEFKVDIVSALIDLLQNKLAKLDGHQITNAACHGDFTPNNLIHDGTAIYGVDISATNCVPVARECALFLVMLHTNFPLPDQTLTGGVSSDDKSALLSTGLLPKSEQGGILDFFIGYTLLRRFLAMHGAPEILDRLMVLITSYFEELK